MVLGNGRIYAKRIEHMKIKIVECSVCAIMGTGIRINSRLIENFESIELVRALLEVDLVTV